VSPSKNKNHQNINNIDFSEYNYCHHCKQFKANYIMSKCQYNSKKHGLMMPALSIINGVQIHNVEPQYDEIIKAILIKKHIRDKKKRKTLEENIKHCCNKYYCSFCLKNYYDISLDFSKYNKDWICPFCTGNCFCSRCMRQDQLTKIRAYIISLS
jgi:hypothetical protein